MLSVLKLKFISFTVPNGIHFQWFLYTIFNGGKVHFRVTYLIRFVVDNFPL